MESSVLHRVYTTEITEVEKREVYGRIVPYNEIARVVDPPGTKWGFSTPYNEMFVMGALARAARAPDRVFLAFEHQPGLLHQLGFGRSLEEKDDGGWGVFKVLDGQAGDHAIEMVKAKMLKAFSVGAVPLVAPTFKPDGTVVRSKCALDEVSLCRDGAYRGAEIHGVRQKIEDPVEAEFEPPQPSKFADRLRALGYVD